MSRADRQQKAPGDAPTSTEGMGANLGGKHLNDNDSGGGSKALLVVKVEPDGPVIVISEPRQKQTLRLLIEKGEKGFTSGEASPLGWARRTSGYAHNLRQLGVPIATDWETLSDGTRVGRYRLTAQLTILSDGDA